MTSKIFKSILSVAVAVLMASLIIIIGVLYPYFGGVQESQLKDELSLAAEATEQLGENYLKNLDSDRYRLTWVGADGTVIFDSHADASAMAITRTMAMGCSKPSTKTSAVARPTEMRSTLPSFRRVAS